MPEFARSRDAWIPAIPDPTTITAPIFSLFLVTWGTFF
jgi:hypothetical protein